MSAPVLSLVEARLRRLAERFLALQTAQDDAGPRSDARALEAELERVTAEIASVIAHARPDAELADAVGQAIAARRSWCEAQHESGPGPRTDDAADAFTLALIELALRLRGRPRRATAAQR
ncbi:hypothetical protein [Sandaracinus amylolyticus]|uniref:hypothetical protein n=1 Tax=Sandaracinus amylolyticus TaxID=927083 RepID=UPI001F2A19DD|nr:hypothetical protein [Sandaracinus amylolyticus]